MKKLLLLLLLAASSLYAQIPIIQPNDLSICDNGGDGIETFDLTSVETVILNGLNPSEYSIGYYNSLGGAETADDAIEFPMSYVNTTTPEIIYVRVEEIADPTNFEVVTFELRVNPLPVFSINDITICEGATGLLDSGLSQGLYVFTWYFGSDAIPGLTENSFFATDAGTYTLVVTNVLTGCSYEDSAVVTVIPGPTAVIAMYSLIDQSAVISISGTPSATVTLSVDNGNQYTITLSATGLGQLTLPINTPNSVICLIEATGSTIPSCTAILSSCVTLVEDSTEIINIPDANFKAKLLEASTTNEIAKDLNGNWIAVDINDNGELEQSEVLLVYGLNVASSEIADLTGITFFTNLVELNCEFNPLTSLNTSGLVNLEKLSAYNCSISTINLSSSSNLKIVSLSSNELTSLDVSNLVDLETISFEDNQIDTINLTGLSNLKYFYCEGNNLSTLDFTGSPLMKTLQCGDNQLIDLNVAGLVNLEVLAGSNNQLTTLDLSGLNSLTYLRCDHNEIANLNLTGATALIEIDASENALLSLDLTGLQDLTKLSVPANNLPVITGLALCTNLTMLHCSSNQLPTLDVSTLVNLTYLNCGENLLQTLTVANSPSLLELECSSNQLQTLSLSNLPILRTLSCSSNQLSSIDANNYLTLEGLNIANNPLNTIDISSLNNLTFLSCGGAQLTNLDTSNLTTLQYLSCSGNQLTSLNLDNFTVLETLHCHSNQLTSLNLNDSKLLSLVDCQSNQLTSLFLKNGKFETLYFQDNPLNYICADEMEVPFIQQQLTQLGLTTTAINSYCSFTPGSEFNSINGNLTIDADNNGCDENDFMTGLIKVKINNGLEDAYGFANETGNYTFYTEEGDFTITPELENPSIFTVSPASATVNFPTNNDLVSTNNFCITANGVMPNAEIVVAPVIPARPGFDAEYKIVYKNTGNQILSGQVYFYYEDAVLDLVSTSVPTSAEATGMLTWNYADLQPFESRSINVTLNVNGPMETPAVNNDDELIFNVATNPINGNEIVFSYFQTVVGSFDPNDIICLEGESEAPSAIGNYLHYIVNFENTGTAPAENVVVKVDIDATKYDVSSLQLLNGSHPLEARVHNNAAEFIFKMINLETNGHGNILLKIRSKESLDVGATVTKKANIFFDYNFPILTNDANTTFQDLAVEEHLMDHSIAVYPNPSHSVVNVEASSVINSVQVYDIQGRLLMTHLADDLKTMIDISNQANGIYFFKIYSDMGIKVERILKK